MLHSFVVKPSSLALKPHLSKMSLMAVHCASKLYYSNLKTQTNVNPGSNPSGFFEVRVKERYILKFQSDKDIDVIVEDITGPVFHFELSIPLHFPSPLARTVYIKDMVSSLNLDPYVCEFVRAEITEVVAETLGKTEGKEEFKKMLAVQVTRVELMGKEEIARIFKEIAEAEAGRI